MTHCQGHAASSLLSDEEFNSLPGNEDCAAESADEFSDFTLGNTRYRVFPDGRVEVLQTGSTGGGSASEGTRLGIDATTGNEVWEFQDPDNSFGAGVFRKVGTSFLQIQPNELLTLEIVPIGGAQPGGGTSPSFTIRQVPGVGLVAINPRNPRDFSVLFPEAEAQPDLRIEVDPRTGNLVTISPTGEIVDTGQQFGFPQFSPERQRANELADVAARRAFEEQQLASQQQFSGQQAGLDRAQQAGQFAQDLQLQRRQQALAGANQFANLISLTDPAALPAFLEAGGGVISNAIASGADALSERALLPAARTLRALSESGQPAFSGGGMFGGAEFTPGPEDIARSNAIRIQRLSDINSNNLTFLGAGGTQSPSPGNQGLIDQGIARINPETGMVEIVGGGSFDPGLVDGPTISAQEGFQGRVSRPTNIVVGENGPEDVNVQPVGGSGNNPHPGEALLAEASAASNASRVAPVGGQERGGRGVLLGDSLAQPGDEPFLSRTRDIREGTPVDEPLGIGPFNVMFRFLPPSVQEAFFRARQTRFGVGVGPQAFEERRFRVQGTSRAFSFAQ